MLIDPPAISGVRPPSLDGLRILVVRADRLGDVVLSLPVLGTLRARCPRARLGLLTSPAAAPLLAGHPWLDRLLVDEGGGGLAGLDRLRRLRRALVNERFDVALILRPTWRHALLCWSAGIPLRAGTAFRVYSPLFFNLRLALHRRGSGCHELELNLAALAGLLGPVESIAPVVPVAADAGATATRLLAAVPGSGALVVLHPGSGGSAREWDRFSILAADLRRRGFRVAVTGLESERALAGAIVAAAPGSVSLAGSTPLPVLAAVLARAEVIVCASTGPMHLAAALGTAIVALFPPIRDATPRRWGPWSRRAVVLTAAAPACPRCIGTRCPYWDCMHTITPEAVGAAIDRLLVTPRVEAAGLDPSGPPE